MSKYNIDNIKEYIENDEFDNLNNVIDNIVNSSNHTFNDLEVLKCLIDSPKIAVESKNKLKYLYLKYKKEIEERIFSGETLKNEIKKVYNTNKDNEMLDIKPSNVPEDSFAYVNYKTIILIIFLIVLIIGAVTFLTIRG